MILPDDDIVHTRNLGRLQHARSFVSITQFFRLQLHLRSEIENSCSVEHKKIVEKNLKKELAHGDTCAILHNYDN